MTDSLRLAVLLFRIMDSCAEVSSNYIRAGIITIVRNYSPLRNLLELVLLYRSLLIQLGLLKQMCGCALTMRLTNLMLCFLSETI